MEKSLIDHLFDLIDLFNKKDVKYVLIGGFAVILYGANRTTGDIDLVLKNEENNIKKLRDVLFELYPDEEINEINSDELKKYSVIRFGTAYNFYIDIISSIGESFYYENIEHVEKMVDGHKIQIASASTLYKMKSNTYREVDLKDLLFLKEYIEVNNAG